MRTKQQIQADIEKKEEELAALQQELREASIEVWVALYDVRDDSQAVVGLVPYEWIETKFRDLVLFHDRALKVVSCGHPLPSDRFVEPKYAIQIDQGAITREDDCVHMRAFTSKDKAEACLDLWIRTAGTSEFE